MNLPCGYVLSAPQGGSLVLCGTPVTIYESGRVLCQRHQPEASYIYVVRRGDYVKIGLTARPVQRLGEVMRGINCKSPAGLVGPAILLALVRGNIRTERLLHAAFAAHRADGEWFRIEDAVANWVNTMDAAEYDLLRTAVDAQHLLNEEAEAEGAEDIAIHPVDF